MLTEEQKADYERAAETFEGLSCPNAKPAAAWKVEYWKAWHYCNNQEAGAASIREIDARAARLLRECIEKGEPLP